MKKYLSILFLFAVLTITNVSFGQDESPGKKVAIEKTTHLAPNAYFIETLNLCDFAPSIKPLTSITGFAFDNILATQPIKCLPSADYGNYNPILEFPINTKKLYASEFIVPAHKTRNCATGYMRI